MDHRYLRWQVIDTPGILDHPLEQRNTIEMQSVTALAHLQCAVLYFIDISEQCGFTVAQQVGLFKSIKPLFANKQLVIVVNKVDQQPFETLDPSKKAMVEELGKSSNCELMTMSNVTEEGVMDVKSRACDKLLQARVDQRVVGKKVNDVMNRLQVFQPQARDGEAREPYIPESVVKAKARGEIGSKVREQRRNRLGKANVRQRDTGPAMSSFRSSGH
jgi:nucleolar GTP-binding protein